MTKNYGLTLLFAGTIIMVAVMKFTGNTLKTPTTPSGILNLEFAYNTHKAKTVIDAWSANNAIKMAKINTWLDFIFIYFYSFFLYHLSIKFSRSFTGFMHSAGKIIATGSLAAGMLDIMENTGMLISLGGYFSNTINALTVVCSLLKWGLVILAVLYILIGAVATLIKRAGMATEVP